MHKNSLNITTSLRLLIILQLCIALSCLIWLAGYPLMGGHFKTQSEQLLIESVMGIQTTHMRLDPESATLKTEKASRNQKRFQKLSETEKNFIENLFSAKKESSSTPFFEVPMLEILWICLGIILPILLLLQKRSAALYIWLLPLVTIAYACNNQIKGKDPADAKFFPREDSISYTKDIRLDWENYLKNNWAKDEKTAEEGEFYFNLARIKESTPLSAPFWEKKSPVLLLIYIIWNFFFAWQAHQSPIRKEANASPLVVD